MLKGENIELKLIEEEDIKKRVEWLNAEEGFDTLILEWPLTIAKTKEWFDRQLLDKSKKNFIIKKENLKIGICGLNNIDYKNKKAELYILIGEKKERGKGYSKEGLQLLLAYGFHILNLNKIYLYVFEDNIRAQNLYKTLNFKKEGLLREEYLKKNKYKNLLIMSILKKEFE